MEVVTKVQHQGGVFPGAGILRGLLSQPQLLPSFDLSPQQRVICALLHKARPTQGLPQDCSCLGD